MIGSHDFGLFNDKVKHGKKLLQDFMETFEEFGPKMVIKVVLKQECMKIFENKRSRSLFDL